MSNQPVSESVSNDGHTYDHCDGQTCLPLSGVRLLLCHNTYTVDVCLQFYGGGVFNGFRGFCGKQVNHGVLAVGMNTKDTNPFYIVKVLLP
jgi:hypothetical protein